MAQIRNTELIKEIIKGAGLQTSMDAVPSELGKTVVPVLIGNVDPRANPIIISDVTDTTQTAKTLYTTPPDKDFYLTYIHLSNMSDATANNTDIILRAMINSTNRDLINFRKLTTTAFNNSVTGTFGTPLKIDRNTVILFRNVFSAGSSNSSWTIIGYVEGS